MTNTLHAENETVTAVISNAIKPGRELAYEEWVVGISAVAREFKGHCGVSIIRPTKGSEPEYVIILKFDCYSNLRNWMDSDVRKDWVERVKPLIQKPANIQVMTGNVNLCGHAAIDSTILLVAVSEALIDAYSGLRL